MNQMTQAERMWFIANAGSGVDGEIKDLSYNGINARLINKGGNWLISSWQRVANPINQQERQVIEAMRRQYALN